MELLLPDTVASMSRRQFLTASAAAAGAALLPGMAWAKEDDFWAKPRSIWLYNPATKDNVRVCYWHDNQLDIEGYAAACRILRDFRQSQAVQMDIVLLDLLRGVTGFYEKQGFDLPIVVHSGFRTQQTNELLKRRGEKPAKNSMHLYGKACDFSIPGVPVKQLLQLGTYFGTGGVGYYPKRDFIHLDTGSVRVWRG